MGSAESMTVAAGAVAGVVAVAAMAFADYNFVFPHYFQNFLHHFSI